VEETYVKSQTKLVRFASNCSNRGYVFSSDMHAYCFSEENSA